MFNFIKISRCKLQILILFFFIMIIFNIVYYINLYKNYNSVGKESYQFIELNKTLKEKIDSINQDVFCEGYQEQKKDIKN